MLGDTGLVDQHLHGETSNAHAQQHAHIDLPIGLRHGGRIDCASTLGQGASFMVRLPLASA